ncbi:MAG: gliding motility protein GldN [Dysgonamonadaceae bacterium]|jgi:gliding motility associated protien GldN|nr:gliding motility protein GldN [Dysgonamonadaceae bacterium]
MKPFYYIGFFVLLFACTQEGLAQDQSGRSVRRQRPSEANAPTVSNLTERARIKNEEASRMPGHIVWERIIYRTVDLTKNENNAALYYPVQPQGDRQNLFTLIFKLLSDGKITAYNYLEGGEVFEESQKVDFEEGFLKKYQLLYTKEGNRFVVDERDIPGSEVTQYMIKEGYSFDQATGTFKTGVIAICPVLVREDFYYGGSTREALFWLKYDDIRPYLSREMIMTSNYNNALTYTIDDYFHKNMYTGDIIKTVNMMGRSLAQEVGTDPEAQKRAQDSIESQLNAFDRNLWIYKVVKDTATVTQTEEGKTKKVKETKSATRGNKGQQTKSSAKQKTEKSSPTRSVRRNR